MEQSDISLYRLCMPDAAEPDPKTSLPWRCFAPGEAVWCVPPQKLALTLLRACGVKRCSLPVEYTSFYQLPPLISPYSWLLSLHQVFLLLLPLLLKPRSIRHDEQNPCSVPIPFFWPLWGGDIRLLNQ